MCKLRNVFALVCVTVAALTAATAKRPINHRDYDHWRTISSQVLSADGKYLAYSQFPEEGDGEVVVRNLTTGKEMHEPAGALPPAPDPSNLEEPAAAGPPASRGVRLSFTPDNRYLVSTTFASQATHRTGEERQSAGSAGRFVVDRFDGIDKHAHSGRG